MQTRKSQCVCTLLTCVAELHAARSDHVAIYRAFEKYASRASAYDRKLMSHLGDVPYRTRTGKIIRGHDVGNYVGAAEVPPSRAPKRDETFWDLAEGYLGMVQSAGDQTAKDLPKAKELMAKFRFRELRVAERPFYAFFVEFLQNFDRLVRWAQLEAACIECSADLEALL